MSDRTDFGLSHLKAATSRLVTALTICLFASGSLLAFSDLGFKPPDLSHAEQRHVPAPQASVLATPPMSQAATSQKFFPTSPWRSPLTILGLVFEETHSDHHPAANAESPAPATSTVPTPTDGGDPARLDPQGPDSSGSLELPPTGHNAARVEEVPLDQNQTQPSANSSANSVAPETTAAVSRTDCPILPFDIVPRPRPFLRTSLDLVNLTLRQFPGDASAAADSEGTTSEQTANELVKEPISSEKAENASNAESLLPIEPSTQANPLDAPWLPELDAQEADSDLIDDSAWQIDETILDHDPSAGSAEWEESADLEDVTAKLESSALEPSNSIVANPSGSAIDLQTAGPDGEQTEAAETEHTAGPTGHQDFDNEQQPGIELLPALPSDSEWLKDAQLWDGSRRRRPLRSMSSTPQSRPTPPLATSGGAGQPDDSILPVQQDLTQVVALPPLPTAVSRQAQQLVQSGVELAERRAAYSARSQFIKALRLISQSLDIQTQSQKHSVALANGLRALTEASDFHPPGSHLEGLLELDEIVSGHLTPILHDQDLNTLSALTARQAYHSYAEAQLALAVGHEPAAADALFGLAKLQDHLKLSSRDVDTNNAPRAMSLYQAALLVNPNHYLAANELGVMFARVGQFEDARHVLRHCIAIKRDTPAVWQNLARVHQALGEQELAQLANDELQALSDDRTHAQVAESKQPRIQWVDPQAFAKLPVEQLGGTIPSSVGRATARAKTTGEIPATGGPYDRRAARVSANRSSVDTTRAYAQPAGGSPSKPTAAAQPLSLRQRYSPR